MSKLDKSNTIEAILMRQGSYSRKNLIDFLRHHLPMLEPTQIHDLAEYLDAWYEASLAQATGQIKQMEDI